MNLMNRWLWRALAGMQVTDGLRRIVASALPACWLPELPDASWHTCLFKKSVKVLFAQDL
jgi:hypothetical protein